MQEQAWQHCRATFKLIDAKGKQGQLILRAWEGMNELLRVAAQVHVGQLDILEGAAIIGMSVDTVRRDVARLNGNR